MKKQEFKNNKKKKKKEESIKRLLDISKNANIGIIRMPETQRVPKKLDPRKNTARHIMIK